MMGKQAIETTYAEDILLGFLKANEGRSFTEKEIQEQTQLRFTLVADVASSLQAKGFPVKVGNKYSYQQNSFMNWLLTVFLCLIIVNIFFFAFLDYLEEDPQSYYIEN